MLEVMSVGLSPSTSAAMIARTVRMPVPRSWVAHLRLDRPVGVDRARDFLVLGRQPPPHWCRATPIPCLIGPAPLLPRGLRFSLQPISSAPILSSAS